jgi:PAS domain S-box-containing protein
MTDKNNDTTEIILDSIADGVFTVDRDWRITSFNRAAEEITGILKEEAIGQRCCDVFHASICETNCALNETFETNRPVVNRTAYIIDADGVRVPISISTAVLRDKKGDAIGGVETFRDLSTIEELRRELEKKYSFHDIISKNSEMLRIFDILPGVAESDSTVLIEGETGTGKELIARALHNLSHRKDKPFVAVNCGALPDTLLESELFGYKAGAFTDARKDKPGRFAVQSPNPGRYSSTKSPTYLPPCRCACCASFRKEPMNHLALQNQFRRMFALSPPVTGISTSLLDRGSSGKIFTIG